MSGILPIFSAMLIRFQINLLCVYRNVEVSVGFVNTGVVGAVFYLTLILLTWTIWRAPTNASKWRMGFNSAFKGLTLILLTWTVWRAPTNASKWRMGFNSAFKGLMDFHIYYVILVKFCVRPARNGIGLVPVQ
jgi:hypothetical protein